MRIGDQRGWVRHSLLVLVLGALGLLVTWLFLKADEISPEAHYAYLRTLRQIQQADVLLNSSVIASYADLVQNYDGMRRQIDSIRRDREGLMQIPAALDEAERLELIVAIERLIEAQQAKEEVIDRFQRANAVLRNSELYLPQAAEMAMRTPAGRQQPALHDFVRRLLGYGRAARLEDGAALLAEMARFEPLAQEAAVRQLLAHARQILERRPEVYDLVQQVMHSPTASLHEAVARHYIRDYEAASERAGRYRTLLYAVSLLLVGYALYAVFRIERDRRELSTAHADLAQRYEAQRRAELELRLYGLVFTHASEGMTITDGNARIVAVNPAFSAITGYAPEEVIGHTPAILNSGRQDESFYQNLWAQLADQGQWQGEIWNRRKDGGIFPEWLSIVAARDENGQTSNYIGVFTDISERKQSEARIHHLAHHDALTGLPNRLLLDDRIQQGILKSRRSARSMALIFIDLDRFKNINDTLGHEVGDLLLVQAAQRGLSVLRDTDTLCRQGGDEFVAVLPELELRQDAAHVARKLLAALCQPYLLAGHELTVSGSAGIALYPEDGENVSELLRKADAAMYRAKEEGRNTFRFFSAEINTASLGELLLENDLFGALDRQELLIHYQPKVDAQSGRLIGAEALMRWRHRQQGMIPPDRFIPLAEENGLINAFGEWAIRTVCAQQRAWLDAGLRVVPVAVNVSAQQFAQQDLPNVVAQMLTRYRLPPHLLELELTESLLMRNASRAAKVLRTLRAMHVRVAIDDFGTGYSSLSYLHQFPVQSLKIDRSFVSQIGEYGETVRLASAIIAMAHELELSVIAEGVESETQSRYLAAHGCDQFQGYLYGRPQPADDFAARLAGFTTTSATRPGDGSPA
ncbi:EAL domain-containing protein [Azonexus sp. R2A61]|uniref:EAL domain-containing protein n=1 Tax=Azonexus sp. R2A61 TaxID=2744443 RepID=UPI001F3D6A80|nr:EAL domain-containing protein [Azonexus sp. R2A61]